MIFSEPTFEPSDQLACQELLSEYLLFSYCHTIFDFSALFLPMLLYTWSRFTSGKFEKIFLHHMGGRLMESACLYVFFF